MTDEVPSPRSTERTHAVLTMYQHPLRVKHRASAGHLGSAVATVGTHLRRIATLIFLVGAAAGLSGCVLAPRATAVEQAKLRSASVPFEKRIEARQLPVLPTPASWQDVLHRAFLANGDLESSYFVWKAALANIDVAATWPNSDATVTFGYLFSAANMKSWNRTSISGGFSPAVPLKLPIKTAVAGKVALEAAREAGETFQTEKFSLQRQVLQIYLDLALAEEKIRIERDNLDILTLLTKSAASRAQTGGPLQDLLKAQVGQRLAQNDLKDFEFRAAALRGILNGLMARKGDAPIALPPRLPSPRPVTANDAKLIAVAVDQNPELAGLARQVAGRQDALELARLAYLPDIIPSAGLTGSVSQAIGAMIMLPTTLPAIRGAIEEATAMQRSSEAILRQTRSDRAASFIANLYLMRNAERQTAFYRRSVVPAARQLLNASEQEYASGAVAFADLIDSERTYISVRFLVAESRIDREKRLADLEALAGVDIETLGQPARPGTVGPRPASTELPLPQYGRSTP